MVKADLHVHSSCSAHPSEWFLQRLGTRESYVDPETVYANAKAAGMDFVTITDHNTMEGVLALRDAHPADVFTGVEVTTYFPEDHTKIHILVWDLDVKQFDAIERLRENIYSLRAFLVETDLAHAVAHATFAINRTLSLEHIERLIVLFDHFEGINGSRSRSSNEIFMQALFNISPQRFETLACKYALRPRNDDSWVKGLVGGSDDHSGLFAARTYTQSRAVTMSEFIQTIKSKRTTPSGRHNDYRGLTFAVYKIACDFYESRKPIAGSLIASVNKLVFDNQPLGFKERLIVNNLKKTKSSGGDRLKRLLVDLVETFLPGADMSTDEKINLLSDKISCTADELFRELTEQALGSLQERDLIGCVKSVFSMAPGAFFTVPFFSAISLMHSSRQILDALQETYLPPQSQQSRRIMWLTDTLTELNGVSETLREIGELAARRSLDLRIGSCVDPSTTLSLPSTVVDFPCIQTYTPSFFPSYTLRIPALLATIRMICEFEPDEIYISTPGPVGLIGLLAARLLHIPSTGIYHTDFTRQFRQIINDDTVCNLAEDYVRWFFNAMSHIAVPTATYRTLLSQRGFDRDKLVPFDRGIDTTVFRPLPDIRHQTRVAWKLDDGFTLGYCGRISKEKSIDFLVSVYHRLCEQHPGVNLVFAGDGPDLDMLRDSLRDNPRIRFLGRCERCQLPQFYAGVDCLVFPSTTDTFGMVVLEAQACGVPAIVSNVGGPQEIIADRKSGLIARAESADDWLEKIHCLLALYNDDTARYRNMCQHARLTVQSRFNWDTILKSIFTRNDASEDDFDQNDPLEDFTFLPYRDIVDTETPILS